MTGDDLRARRTALGLSKGQLARVLDVSHLTLVAWDQGRRPIRRPILVRLILEALAARMDGQGSIPHQARGPAVTRRLPPADPPRTAG